MKSIEYIQQICCPVPAPPKAPPVPPASKNTTKTEKPPVLQAFSMYGIANQDGIVFSSLNGIATVQNPSNSIFGSIFSPAMASQPTNIYSNPAPTAATTIANSNHAPGHSSLTFAPLAASLGSTITHLPSKPIQRPSLPSAFSPAMASSSNQYVVTRPENQCGLSNVTKSRVVGGDITQIGKSYYNSAQFAN